LEDFPMDEDDMDVDNPEGKSQEKGKKNDKKKKKK